MLNNPIQDLLEEIHSLVTIMERVNLVTSINRNNIKEIYNCIENRDFYKNNLMLSLGRIVNKIGFEEYAIKTIIMRLDLY